MDREPHARAERGSEPLARRLTLFDMTLMAIGSTIGSGVFLTPSSIAKSLASPAWMLAVWVFGGAMALSGALTFAELGARMPRAGGLFEYLVEAYGELVGFLQGWAYFLVVTTGAIAALCIAFATYVAAVVPPLAAYVTPVAMAGLAAVTIVNVLGVKQGAVLADVLAVLKLLGVAALIACGLTFGTRSVTAATSTGVPGAAAIGTAMVGVLWSYGGWQHVTFTGGEAKRPTRDVPLAMVLGALAVTLVYLLANVAYLKILSPEEIAASPRLASDAMERAVGRAGGTLVAVTVAVSTLNSAAIYTLTGPRMYWAMARRGLFFDAVARTHARYQTPAVAIVVQSSWAAVLILLWGTFEKLISYVVFTDWIFFGLVGATIFVFRRRDARTPEGTGRNENARTPEGTGRNENARTPEGTAPEGYRTPGYPVTPLFFVGVALVFVASTLVGQPLEAAAGLGFLALGVPAFVYLRRSSKSL